MIAIFTGLPGSGKSTLLARHTLRILRRNRKWFEKTGIQRKVWLNLKVCGAIEDKYGDYICYWSDLRQLTPLRDVDVVMDEVATYFDARLWDTLSLEMRRWLAQHRKFGIEIYGTAQDFAQVDIAFRRLTSDLVYLRKIAGTRDISPTRPAPRWVFVVSFKRNLDPGTYDEAKSKFASKDALPWFVFITRSDVELFDTRAEIAMSKALPLKHIERVCENPACPFHKTQHV